MLLLSGRDGGPQGPRGLGEPTGAPCAPYSWLVVSAAEPYSAKRSTQLPLVSTLRRRGLVPRFAARNSLDEGICSRPRRFLGAVVELRSGDPAQSLLPPHDCADRAS